MINNCYIFAFQTFLDSNDKLLSIGYCYGDTYLMKKHGVMNIIKSPFLVKTFVNLIENLSKTSNLTIVSNLKSIIIINHLLKNNNLPQLTNVIEINSYINAYTNMYGIIDLPTNSFTEIYDSYIHLKYNIARNECLKNTLIISKKDNSIVINGISYPSNKQSITKQILNNFIENENSI